MIWSGSSSPAMEAKKPVYLKILRHPRQAASTSASQARRAAAFSVRAILFAHSQDTRVVPTSKNPVHGFHQK